MRFAPNSHLSIAAARVLLVVVLLSSHGCSSQYGDMGLVTGTVTLDDAPLSNANVEFIPDQGRSSFAKTDSDGRYELNYVGATQGALPGHHRVEITTKEISGGDGRPERLPPRYNRKSELTADVTRGEQKIDFELRSK